MALRVWEHLQVGEVNVAIVNATTNLRENRSASTANELGIVYLWLREYEAAWLHYHRAQEELANNISVFYGKAGIAKWCQGDWCSAFDEWRAGLRCEYTDWAGGISIPLVMWAAAVLADQAPLAEEAIVHLIERLRSDQSVLWPGPLASWIVGDSQDFRLKREGSGQVAGDQCTLDEWQVEFYKGVMDLRDGKADGFRHRMRICGNVSWIELAQAPRVFFGKIWSDEFFVARHQLDSLKTVVDGN